jgi:hypothetical protein
VYGIARRFAPRGAMVAAPLLALHPAGIHTVASGGFLDFTLGTFLALAALACLSEALWSPGASRRWLLGASVAAAFAVWSEESFVLLAIAVPLWARWRPAPARIRAASLAPAVAPLAAAAPQLAHFFIERSNRFYRFHAWDPPPVSLADRVFTGGSDLYLYLRKMFLIASPDSALVQGPSPGHELASATGLLEASAVLAAVAGLVLAAARAERLRALVLLGLLPAIAMLVEPIATRVLFDFARWPGLRQVVLPVGLLLLGMAPTLDRLLADSGWRRAVIGGLVLAFGAWSMVHTAALMRRLLSASRDADAQIQDLSAVVGADTRLYTFGAPSAVTKTAWIAADHPGRRIGVAFVTDPWPEEPDRITRVDAHTLEIRRPGDAPFSWLEPAYLPSPAWRAAFARTAGRINRWPIVEPFQAGATLPLLPFRDDRITILELDDNGVPRLLRLVLARRLDDPSVLLVAWINGRAVRFRCPEGSAECAPAQGR